MILAIDPGETTGYVVYDPDAMRVEARGLFRGHDQVMLMPARCVVTVVVLERLVPHGASYPQVVTSAYVGGRLTERTDGQVPTHELERQRVRNVLQEATHGAIKVKDDKTVWAALKLLHGGDDSDKRGGPLFGVKTHERAAVAVAAAWRTLQGGAWF